MVTVLIIDDESHIRKVIGGILKKSGYDVIEAKNGIEGLNKLNEADIVITDIHMPEMDGMEFLEQVRNRMESNIPVIILTAYSTTEIAIKAVKLGAFDYIKKPFEKDELLGSVEKAAATVKVEEKNYFDSAKDSYIPIMEGKEGSRILSRVKKIAHLNVNILLTGETGTGKSLLASYIHSVSNRANKPLIKVNCSAIPPNLIESELFGHKKGAFTGAYETKLGKFQLANGGTIFLDEIGEIPLELQAKLLNVIQEREVQMIGAEENDKVDIRIICATNRDINKSILNGEFRKDLYYRISTIHLHLPPLRERLDELEVIIDYLIKRIEKKYGINGTVLDKDSLKVLSNYGWPGNIRELQNVLERFVLLGELTLSNTEKTEEYNLDAIQTEAIKKALKVSGNNIKKAAELLGISRRTLYNRIKELDIEIN